MFRAQRIIRPYSKLVNFYILSILAICLAGISSASNVLNIEKKKEPIDDIELKQNEMQDTIVFVKTRRSTGSGTIIDRISIEDKEESEYRVLTNAHVTHPRFFKYLLKVNSITGEIKTKIVDTGCMVVTFDYDNSDWTVYFADVIKENIEHDLAVLSFVTKEELAIARIADEGMLEKVRVFDEIFVIGCQLGRAPSPTFGIISQLLTRKSGEKEWTIYCNTAQITPGSSGGGLFKKYDDHYYLIGIPYKIAMAPNGQLVPHLAYAISMSTAKSFIDQSSVGY